MITLLLNWFNATIRLQYVSTSSHSGTISFAYVVPDNFYYSVLTSVDLDNLTPATTFFEVYSLALRYLYRFDRSTFDELAFACSANSYPSSSILLNTITAFRHKVDEVDAITHYLDNWKAVP